MLNQNAFGHYLYSWDMLEVKGSRDKLTVRSTCPRCRDERTRRGWKRNGLPQKYE